MNYRRFVNHFVLGQMPHLQRYNGFVQRVVRIILEVLPTGEDYDVRKVHNNVREKYKQRYRIGCHIFFNVILTDIIKSVWQWRKEYGRHDALINNEV